MTFRFIKWSYRSIATKEIRVFCLCVSDAPDDLMLVFRGSTDFVDLLIGAWFRPAAMDGGDINLRVHGGMHDALFSEGRHTDIVTSIVDTLKEHSFKRLLVTGHSSGGTCIYPISQ